MKLDLNFIESELKIWIKNNPENYPDSFAKYLSNYYPDIESSKIEDFIEDNFSKYISPDTNNGKFLSSKIDKDYLITEIDRYSIDEFFFFKLYDSFHEQYQPIPIRFDDQYRDTIFKLLEKSNTILVISRNKDITKKDPVRNMIGSSNKVDEELVNNLILDLINKDDGRPKNFKIPEVKMIPKIWSGRSPINNDNSNFHEIYYLNISNFKELISLSSRLMTISLYIRIYTTIQNNTISNPIHVISNNNYGSGSTLIAGVNSTQSVTSSHVEGLTDSQNSNRKSRIMSVIKKYWWGFLIPIIVGLILISIEQLV